MRDAYYLAHVKIHFIAIEVSIVRVAIRIMHAYHLPNQISACGVVWCGVVRCGVGWGGVGWPAELCVGV